MNVTGYRTKRYCLLCAAAPGAMYAIGSVDYPVCIPCYERHADDIRTLIAWIEGKEKVVDP